jgi:hypothetical protein
MGSYKKPEADNTRADKWSEEDENRLLDLSEKLGEDAVTQKIDGGDDEDSLTLQEISDRFPDRSFDAVKNKLRKLRKQEGIYNSPYQEKKYDLNREWINHISKEVDGEFRVFDGYAGTAGSANIYFNHADFIECCEMEGNLFGKLVGSLKDNRSVQKELEGTTTTGNDKVVLRVDDTEVRCYNENVNNILHRRVGNCSPPYHFIDLDPCGSPFVSVPQAIRLLEDGFLAVTYGDLQLQRWGRDGPLTKAYRMPAVDSFEEVIEYMIGWTMFEGIRQEKSTKTRKVEVVDLEILPKKSMGVARVLYKVKKKPTLAPVMNYLEETLQEFEGGQSPVNAHFDIDTFQPFE